MVRSVAAVTLFAALAALAAAPLARAQAPAPASLAVFKADCLAEIGDVEKKVKALAEAIPEEKWGWRPAPGVRSVGEVFAHVAGGNYFLAKMAGTPIPAEVPKEIEKVAGKKEILAWLDRSFAHVRAAIEAATPEAMAKEVDFFGEKVSGRGLYLKAYGHMSEHLGQAIAYARSIGVTPPWSKAG